MKKLALILAIVLVACFAFVACEKVEDPTDSSTGNNTPTSSVEETPNSSEEPNNSTEEPGDVTPAEGALVSGQLLDFSKFEMTADKLQNGITFLANSNGGVDVTTTTSEKRFVNGPTFAAGTYLQLGASGSATQKALKFKVASAGTLEVYCVSGGSGFTPKLAFAKADGTGVVLTAVAHASNDYAIVTLTVAEAGEYVLYSNKPDAANEGTEKKSINVFGLKFVA